MLTYFQWYRNTWQKTKRSPETNDFWSLTFEIISAESWVKELIFDPGPKSRLSLKRACESMSSSFCSCFGSFCFTRWICDWSDFESMNEKWVTVKSVFNQEATKPKNDSELIKSLVKNDRGKFPKKFFKVKLKLLFFESFRNFFRKLTF